MLPDIDGLEVLGALQADPATAGTPVVMASARVGRAGQRAALAAGASAYVLKPFDPRALVAVVAQVAGGGPSPPTPGGRAGAGPGARWRGAGGLWQGATG